MVDVTRILSRIDEGDSSATDQLLPLVYEELRRLAADRLSRENAGQTLQATALVHEAYLRLLGPEGADGPVWSGRGHFFAAAAEAMRRILVEQARRKQRIKHGGGRRRDVLGDPPAPEPDERLLALDEALDRLAEDDPVAARVVEMRRFAGLNHEQVATTLDMTVYEARQKWSYARAWLRVAMKSSD